MAKESNVAGTQETPKKEKAYKVICGIFKARNVALQEASVLKRKGVNAVLAIGKEGYSVVCADGVSRAMAEEAKKEIEAKGLKAVISEQ